MIDPLIARRVMMWVALGVVAVVWMVTVEVPVEVLDVGLKAAVVPVGRPVALKVVAALKPPCMVSVRV